MKTAISLPNEMFDLVNRVAQQNGLSRSEFFRRAVDDYVERLASQNRTAAINAAIDAGGDDGTDPVWTAASRRGLLHASAGDDW